jgi:Putative peptidoglycan binding domain
MKIFLTLLCSIAVVFFAPAAHAKKKDQKSGHGGAVVQSTGKSKKANDWNSAKYSKKEKNWNKAKKANWSTGQAYNQKWKVKTKHYNLSYKYNPNVQNVKFQKNHRITGSQYWHGERYTAFRNYNPEWHDRGWWNNHYKRVVFNSGGWYYWNSGWWYPAWGYAPNAYYAYNGPIYAYNGLTPDQVIANVQVALEQQGYYRGGVDGLLGPLTRAALADYQRDHGLYTTSAIDRPTLESLGLT